MVLLLPLLLILLLLLILSYYYFCYYFACIIIITIAITITFFWYVEPIWPEGSPFGRFFTLGCCELKEQVSTQTYLYNP